MPAGMLMICEDENRRKCKILLENTRISQQAHDVNEVVCTLIRRQNVKKIPNFNNDVKI